MLQYILRSCLWLGTALPALLLLSAAAIANPTGVQVDSTRPLQTSPSMVEDTRYLIEALEKAHYRQMPISRVQGTDIIAAYLETLDRNRLFLTAEDVDEFNLRFGTTIIELLRRGNLYPALLIFEHYRNRVNDRIEWIYGRLDEPFDFSTSESFEPDRSEQDWPKDIATADELWDRRLKYELLNEILSSHSSESSVSIMDPIMDIEYSDSEAIPGETTTEGGKEPEEEKSFEELLAEAIGNVRKRYERLQRSIRDFEAHEIQEAYLSALATQYDPHSTFLSADSREDFSIAMGNSLVGIGAVLTDEDGYTTIRELVPGGPAEECGLLHPNDRIVGVAEGDGEMVDIIGMKLRKVVKMIRGDKGSVVRLLIRPADGDPAERRVVTLVRDEIHLTANLASARLYSVPADDGSEIRIGVIDLPAFYGSVDGKDSPSTTEDVRELIEALKKSNVEGIVLDLRRNGGGMLKEAIDLTGLFIPLGPVVQVRSSDGTTRVFSDRNPMVAWEGPLAVLTSRYSASASEIVAGALRNYRRALIIGESSTHGKGTVQTIFEFDPAFKRGAAKVTVQKYYLPDGSSTQIKGVPSDVVLPGFNEALPIGESDLKNAMEWDILDRLPFDSHLRLGWDGEPIDDQLIVWLSARSRERQQSLEEFQFLNRSIEWFTQRQEQKAFSLNYEERLAQMKMDNEFREQMRSERKKLAESNFDYEEFLLESVKNVMDEEAEDQEMTEADDDESQESAPLDIHLRECLRIVADWITLFENPERKAILASVSTVQEPEVQTVAPR